MEPWWSAGDCRVRELGCAAKNGKDPTIREKFNTYRFADHKEEVVSLLARIVTNSGVMSLACTSMATREAGRSDGQARTSMRRSPANEGMKASSSLFTPRARSGGMCAKTVHIAELPNRDQNRAVEAMKWHS